MDWSDCPLVERIPGKVSGAWLLKDTRLPADAVLDNYDAGESVTSIAEMFEVPEACVRDLVSFAEARRRVRA